MRRLPRPARCAAAAVALVGCLAAAAGAREPFYMTPVPDEATRLHAADPNGAVYPLYSESHALLIGLSNYSAFTPSLPGVRTEVGRLADVLHLHRFKVEVHFDLAGAELVSVIHDFMRRRATVPNARILVYLSGHGISIPYTRPFGYLVPVDAPNENAAGRPAVAAASLPMQMFAAWAQIPTARHMLFVFDACFSGSFFGRPEGPPPPGPLYPLPPAQGVGGAPTTPWHPRPTELPVARGPEASNYIFQNAPRSLGRQFLTAGGALETVPASSVFSDLFIRILEGSGDATARVQSNFDHWTTGEELGRWLESNGRDHYRDPRGAASPVFGSLQDNLFQTGTIVFARLDTPNPYVVADGLPPFPGPVAARVQGAVLAGSAGTPAVAAAYQAALDLTRTAASAEAAARVLEAKARAQGGPIAASSSVERARSEASQAQAQADRAVGELRERIVLYGTNQQQSVERPQPDPAAVVSEVVALGTRTAAVPPPRDGRVLSPEDERSLQQIVDDLSSDLTEVRRGARRRLSDFLTQLPRPKSTVAISRLLQNLSFKSYRFQLGVAVAVTNLPDAVAVESPSAARAELRRALDAPAGRDPTLRPRLNDALAKIPQA